LGIGATAPVGGARQLHRSERGGDALVRRRPVEPAERGKKAQVLAAGEARPEHRALVQIADPWMRAGGIALTQNAERARRRRDEAGRQPNKCGLARAILAEQAEAGATGDRERDVAQREKSARVALC